MQLFLTRPVGTVRFDYQYINRSAHGSGPRQESHRIDGCSDCEDREVYSILQRKIGKRGGHLVRALQKCHPVASDRVSKTTESEQTGIAE